MAIHDLSEAFGNFRTEPEPTGHYGKAQLVFFRLLMGCGALLAVVWVFACLFMLLFATCCMRRAAAHGYWGYTRLGGACLAGCLCGLFSPRFGVSIVCVYLLLCADEEGEGGLARLLRSRFQDAFYKF